VRKSSELVDARVAANLPLVGYQVSELLGRVPTFVPRDDLTSAGALALVQAAHAFDASLGVPFASYAALRIRGALVDELRAMDWVSRAARQRARWVSTTSDEMASRLGRSPSRVELASKLGATMAELDAARGSATRPILSIDAADNAIGDTLRDRGSGPEEALLAAEQLHHLRAAVGALPEQLRYVVAQLFFHDRTYAQLAVELGLTESRISQLRTQGLAMLRDGMNASLDPDLVPASDRPGGAADRRRQAYFDVVAQQASFLGRASQLAGSVPAVPRQRARTAEPADPDVEHRAARSGSDAA